MSLKSILSKPFAKYITRRIAKWSSKPVETQQKVFRYLIDNAKNTAFGKDHSFHTIKTYEDFVQHVPVRDYEGLKPYIERATKAEPDVLWKGKPIYFCKTSGTTSGTKYIPITKESIPYHINAARDALLSYIAETGDAGFLDGKLIFLSGSPELNDINGIPLGRLSGIVNHHVPSYLKRNQLPSYETNCIEDWEEKLDAIIDETLDQKMTLISGIPSWVQMYFDRLIERTGKGSIKEIFPHFSLFVHGGVNYEPYRGKFERTIGKKIPTIETYPASEGFIAYQNSQHEEGLLLLLNSGIFYEFIPAAEAFNENPTRLSIKDVEIGENYAIILNTNAGLWGYNIGDTVKFVSKDPYKLVVTGRIKHFISAFGEHVIAEEVEQALNYAAKEQNAEIIEFTVAPQVSPEGDQLPYHEWFIEFGALPENMTAFRDILDSTLQKKNIYYKDLIEGNILQKAVIRPVQKGGFISYMKSQGKLGGQNKVPRLSNDRKIAEGLKLYISGHKI